MEYRVPVGTHKTHYRRVPIVDIKYSQAFRRPHIVIYDEYAYFIGEDFTCEIDLEQYAAGQPIRKFLDRRVDVTITREVLGVTVDANLADKISATNFKEIN